MLQLTGGMGYFTQEFHDVSPEAGQGGGFSLGQGRRALRGIQTLPTVAAFGDDTVTSLPSFQAASLCAVQSHWAAPLRRNNGQGALMLHMQVAHHR